MPATGVKAPVGMSCSSTGVMNDLQQQRLCDSTEKGRPSKQTAPGLCTSLLAMVNYCKHKSPIKMACRSKG